MALIDANGKLFGRINVIDLMIGAMVLAGVLGVFLVQSGTYVTSGQVVEGESDIAVSIQIPMLKTLDSNLFVPGQKTSITIRNQPRGEVMIESVKREPARMMVASSDGTARLVEDLAQENSFNYTLRLRDHAKITKDGYVTEGVKVKVGLPIELEGFKYRVHGKIVDVEALQ